MKKNKYEFKLNTAEANDSHMGLAKRIKPGEKILELGCSSGYLSRFLKQDLGCYVVGVDIDADALKEASEYCDKTIVADLDNPIWMQQIAGDSFDTILCADVLEHLKNPALVLAKLKPFLTSRGRILTSIPNVAHASVRLELLQGHFDYESLGILDDTHLHFYTLDGCVNMLMQAGFLCNDVSYSIHDIADEVIDDCFKKLGMSISAQGRSIFHAPEASAFQFILEAFPAKQELLRHKPPVLTPKPLISSGAAYSHKQEIIESLKHDREVLENERNSLLVHNKNHQKNIAELEQKIVALVQECADERVHNQNHLNNIHEFELKVEALTVELAAEQQHNLNHQAEIQAWVNTGRALDEGLFNLTLQVEKLTQEKQRLNDRLAQTIESYESEIQQFRNRIEQLHNHVGHLEAVLQRVHKKVSYRAVRFLKNTPQNLVSKLKGLHHETEAPNEAEQAPESNLNVHDYKAWLMQYQNHKDTLAQYTDQISKWRNPPKIAIVMPTYNPSRTCLEEAINSVKAQCYSNWELCIADDASSELWVKELLEEYARQDARIKVLFRSENGHISQASNSALGLVSAEYLALMDHDDLITPDALYWVVKTIIANPDVSLIYSDEDKLNIEGERYGPYFKPDWNPELLLSHNFVCHLGVYKTQKVRDLGGFDPNYDGAQDYDLTLRYVATLKDEQIKHIPKILYHWRATPGSTANGIQEKPYAEPLIRKAVQRALSAKGIVADVVAHAKLPGALRVRYQLPEPLPLVSIVIPTRNGFTLLKRCIDSLLKQTDYANIEIIIIDNGSDDWIALRYLEYLKADSRIRVLSDKRPFNYAALNNTAVQFAQGEYIALLNNDLEVINSDWLNEMVSYAQFPEVGAVGAKLYYPNDLIQHAGVIVGLGGVAGHSHKHFPRDSAGFCGRLFLTQNLSAVTAACLVVRKSIFEQVRGFDEVNLSVAFNDVDLCLRIQEAGYRNVWTPYAELYHYESATRGYEDTVEKQARFTAEIEYMKRRWGARLLEDPAYNPNLTLDREDFSFAYPPRI